MNTAGLAFAAFGLGASGFLGFDYATSSQPLARDAWMRTAAGLGLSGYSVSAIPSQVAVRHQFDSVAKAIATPGAAMPAFAMPVNVNPAHFDVRQPVNGAISPPLIVPKRVELPTLRSVRPVPAFNVPPIKVSLPPPPRIYAPIVPRPAFRR